MANKYTVGWICAVVTEYVAARALLDQIHEGPDTQAPYENNTYTLGEIGKHNVVIAVLPDGEYGTSSAASVAKDMLRTFTNIRIGLMVGIGGGVPSAANDIRLGDVVVSSPRNGIGGVIQYDFGKSIQGQGFCRTGILNLPPTSVRTAITVLKAEHISEGHGLQDIISSILEMKPRLRKLYARPDPSSDILYSPDYLHHDGAYCTVGDANDGSKVIVRQPRDEGDDTLAIHYGLIASGNALMKDALVRDRLAAETGVLCFEMEAAGSMNQCPFLVVRGICDYSDTHKNKSWQGYAAMTAAAYTRELLYRIPPSKVDCENRIAEQVLESVARTEENIQRLTATAYRKDVEDILEWLISIDYGPMQSDIIKLRQPETGQWFLNTDEYRMWVSGNNNTLYCPGIPGAGKTMITSIVIDDILRIYREDPTLGVAFIFCNFQRNEQQTTDMLLCSLLKQLVAVLPNSPRQLNELYQTHRKLRTRPSVQELSTLIQVTLAAFSRAFFVVDALDECRNSDASRDRFLNVIFGLQASTGVNIFLTSRIIPDIEKDLSENRRVSKLEIAAEEDDIQKYIRGRISEMPQFIISNPTLRDEVIMGISSSVKGMFLLAKLQFDSLKERTSIRDVRMFIKHTSTNESGLYNSAYENALQRIESQSPKMSDLAKRVILWITHSIRQLSETEIRYALSVRPDSLSFDRDDLVQIDLVSVCAGLVVVDVGSSVIRLVHLTAHDFFARMAANHFGNCHNILADTCITYLSYRTFEGELSPDNASYQRWLQSNPFYVYAATEWGCHVLQLENNTQEALSSTEERALQFLRNQNLVESAGHTLMTHALLGSSHDYAELISAPIRPNALHIAAYFGLEKVLSELVRDYTTKVTATDGETEMSWLASSDPDAVEPGLVYRPQHLEVTDQLGRTPLYWASIMHREGVMRLLVGLGASLEAANENGFTPLFGAAIDQRHDTLRLLVELGASLEAVDKTGYNPLFFTAIDQRHDTLRLLVELGASLEVVDKSGFTPLFNAAINQRHNTLRLLVELGASLEAVDRNGYTPIFYAAKGQRHDTLRLLVELGASLEAVDRNGYTPISYAAMDQRHDTLRLLVELGASLEAVYNDGFTLLSIMVAIQDHDTLRLLVDLGASIDATDDYGRTALHYAASNGQETLVQLLVDLGASIDVHDGTGRTALDLAIALDKKSNIQLLTDLGASVTSMPAHLH
ncbi:unnamed protein product [Clonostachys rosea]|uniref:Nucleoside phosphorylase domain-containing protein n=1 Tax=Bionectria ochroleuca TaxID=29856 RepID=A0ABY6UVQ7_BIOOC|nr:unnamed protein product [Clonostachys rosea]